MSEGIRQPSSKQLDQQEKIKANLTPAGLNQDVMNIFTPVALLASDIGPLDKIEKLPTYAEYFAEIFNRTPDSDMARYVIEKSNSEAVGQFDALVREFNEDLDRIKKESDRNAIIRFANRAGRIVHGSNFNAVPEIQFKP